MSFDGDINMTMPKKKKAKPTVIYKRKTLEFDIAPEIKRTNYSQGKDVIRYYSRSHKLWNWKPFEHHWKIVETHFDDVCQFKQMVEYFELNSKKNESKANFP